MSTKRIAGSIIMVMMLTLLMLSSAFIVPDTVYAASTTPAKPSITSISVNDNTITIKWKNAKGAKSYRVYVQTGETKWKYWKKVKKTAANKKKYADKLKYKIVSSGKKYKVYKQQNPFKVAAKTVKGRKYTFKGKYGKTYSFAIKSVNGKKISAASAVKKKKIPEQTPEESQKTYTLKNLPYSDHVIYDEPIALINEYGAFLAVDTDNRTLMLSNKPYMWKLTQSKEGSHVCSVKYPDLVIDLDNAWYQAGNSVHLYGDTGDACQYWNLNDSGSNGFVLTSAQKPEWCIMSSDKGFILGASANAGANETWKLVRDGSWVDSFTSPAEYPFYRYESKSITPTPDFWSEFDAHGITDDMKAEDSTGEDIYAQYARTSPVMNTAADGYDFFSVDFRTESQPDYTYWALAEWYMDSTEYMSLNGYSDVESIGAYAGLQDTGESTAKIMSIWESYFYGEDGRQHTLIPECVYPEGESTSFDGEGSGVSLVSDYNWKPDTWYRFVLRSWEEDDTTYVGTWLEDLSTGEVSLLAVYDTHLPKSYITNIPTQFLENYGAETHGDYRQMKLRNYCLRDRKTGEWYFPDSAAMGIWASLELDNRGTYRFLTDGESITAETCGLGADACEGKTDEETESIVRFRPAASAPDVSKYVWGY